MIIINASPNFDKSYRKRIQPFIKLEIQFKRRLEIFTQNPHHSLLKDHALHGHKTGLRAFSVAGDIRVVYHKISSNEVILYDIGSHNQVY